ncbi:alpha/beta hydrolase [Terricaulis silvestris]|uniref:Carboxylesterase NlhH n=1 Tax=Terricaulis silvestris TaxID=2686094 RepID=A0A6I6MR95_9CAUL|nr:alpha/beta hydrolase [Terricaulis silvestris]QGZ95184.1 Carboxylesterase NlhH [Terricaulis silvestris]
MRRRTLLAALPFLAGCTPSLGTFDSLTPRDAGVRRVARDMAYGEGARRKLDVYAPTDAAAALPVIVFIYGGSWATGDKDDYEFLGAALASRGFMIVVPDYRLVPEVRFPSFVEDCAAAVRWVSDHVAEYGGDGRRIVLVGHSAGGYNAVMLALAGDYLRSAGVADGSIRGAVGLAGPYDFLPFDVNATRNAFGQAPDPQLTQPVHFARADAPPLLLLWGVDDDTVGPRNLESLARVQRAAGGRVETKIYQNVDHIDILIALSRPFRGRAPVLDDVTAFARAVTD